MAMEALCGGVDWKARLGLVGAGGYRIAVSGHRPNRLPRELIGPLREQSKRVLTELAAALAPAPLSVCSALAEGADRIVASAGLACNLPLQVWLPFAREDYQRDFVSVTARQEFTALLEQAQQVKALCFDYQHHRNSGYVAVGEQLVHVADVLIAIWDGQPARGAGGTAEVVQGAIDKGIPVIWLPPQQPLRVRLLNTNNNNNEQGLRPTGSFGYE